MQIFYAPDIRIGKYILDKNESKHAVRALRMAKGDELVVVDGDGCLYEGIITDPDPICCEISVRSITRNFEKRGYRLHIAISPVKNHERFEWFVEKSVEIGIDEITPVICRYTEKPAIKSERLENIIISSMKQSIKAFKPVLNEPVSFNEFVSAGNNDIKMIAHCHSELERSKIEDVCEKNRNVVILIGPEGDFSDEEINLATHHGFSPVHLGKSRLRTETAGIAACNSVYFINQ